MEAGARLAPPPVQFGAFGPAGLSWRGWLGASMLLAAGAGVVAAWNSEVALDLALLTLGIIAVVKRPLAVLVIALLVETRHSPFAEILVAASCIVFLPRLLHAPARMMLIPLAVFLLLVLPGIDFGGSQLSAVVGNSLVIPGANIDFLTRPSPEFLGWLRVAFALALATLAALTVRNAGQVRLVVGAIVVGSAYPTLVGLQQLTGGQYVAKGSFKSVKGPFDFPNEFGFYLVIVLMLSIVAIFELQRRSARIGAAVLALGALVMLEATYTRAAWIGFALGFLVLALFQYRRLILVAVLALVLAVVAAPGAVNQVQARFGDLSSQNAANSKNSYKWRRGEWSRMLHYGDEKPLTGQGFGSYQRMTIKEFGYQDGTFSTIKRDAGQGVTSVGFAAHNDYVKLYVETGVPGVLLWVCVLLGLIVTAATAARAPALRPWAIAVAALGLAFALMSYSDNIQGYGVPVAMLFALTGALAGAYRRTAPPSRAQAG